MTAHPFATESSRRRRAVLVMTAALILIAAVCVISINTGHIRLSPAVVAKTLFGLGTDREELILFEFRLPRIVISILVGAALAVSGCILQGITRNALADPGILGINAGAAFFVVAGSAFFGLGGLSTFATLAFIGAAVAAALVYMLGSIGSDGLTPLKVTLAGAAMTAFFSSLSLGILMTSGKTFDQVLFWFVGSVAGRDLDIFLSAAPYMFTALIGAWIMARHMNLLTLGEEVATGLGQNIFAIKLIAGVFVVLLAGGSVSVAGPIAFVGIMIPHLTRHLVGLDHRWVIPYSAVLGGILLLYADIGSRYIAFPKEVPVGVMTAIIGVPFFVYIARRGDASRT